MDKPRALVVGGTSGLGLELALLLQDKYRVFVVGRNNVDHSRKDLVSVVCTNLSNPDESTKKIVTNVMYKDFHDYSNPIDLLIYAAGFYQECPISLLTLPETERMVNVGLVTPAVLLNRITRSQDRPLDFIAITSTSQFTPRPLEPVYTAVKAGLAVLANSVSLDPKMGKVLVAAPAGMKTKFWRDQPERDMSKMLDPKWVATQIIALYNDRFKYRFAKILREPPRVEVVETRR